MKKKMTVHRLLSGALVLLGFASCSNEDENLEIRCEYGTPYSKFLVKGTVTSDKDEPLKNIQVIIRQDWNNGVFPADTIYTDEKGESTEGFMDTAMSAITIVLSVIKLLILI